MKQALWKAIRQFLMKLNIYSPYDPAILLGGLCLGKIKIYVQRLANINCSFIPNNSKLETSILETSEWENKLVHLCNGMLHSNVKKKGSILFLKRIIYLFIYFWLRWVFVAARRLSLAVASGGYSSLQCVGFSLWWLLLLWSMGSRHMGFSSCGT